MSQFVIHTAESRGSADFGWLKPNYYFSFSNYYNPERIHFGMLRVLNDDYIAGGMGFPKHPHDNMEIITIPFEGAIVHEDSMGNSSVVNAGDIQVMSAGSGVLHSEKNYHSNLPLKLFQIWIFPNQKNVEPRYQQITLDKTKRINNWQQILSPNSDDEGVWIHQNAWMMMGDFDAKVQSDYQLNNTKNGVYIVVIKGQVEINQQLLNTKDAIGIWNTSSIQFNPLEKSEILIIEIPMN